MSRSGEQPELRSGLSSFPWNINHHLIERCEGFDSQPMTPPSDLILKEPPKIKPRRSKYWSFLGEQEKIPETSEVKTVKPTDLRTYISPQDNGEEITFVHTRPIFYTPHAHAGHRSPTQEVSMEYSEMSAGDITSEVMNHRLSAGSTCTEEGMEGIPKTLALAQPDDLMAELFDDVTTDSSNDAGTYQDKAPERCMSETSLGRLSFGGLFKPNPTENTEMEISDTSYRQRSLSTTDLMSHQQGQLEGSSSNSETSLLSRIHNRFSASTEALRQMQRNLRRFRHASGPEVSTTTSAEDKPESPSPDKEPEHHKVALNAVLMSS